MNNGDGFRIRMLGGFSVFRGGRPLVLPTRKAAALLAILASRPDVLFSRERLAGLLWARSAEVFLGPPESGEAHARLAMRLNPFHDDWYFAFAAAPSLFTGRIETAIEYGLKAPDIATDAHAYLTCAFAHFGERDAAARHLVQFESAYRRDINGGREPRPDEAVRWLMHVNPFRRREDMAFFLDGLAHAGLAVPSDLMRAA